MAQAAYECLAILETVSSIVLGLRETFPGPLKTISQKLLPQGIDNNVEDPREMVQQLGAFCCKLVAKNKELQQALETEKEDLLAKLHNYQERVNAIEEPLEDSLSKLVKTQEELKDKTEKLKNKTKELKSKTKELGDKTVEVKEMSSLQEKMHKKLEDLDNEREKLLSKVKRNEEHFTVQNGKEQKLCEQVKKMQAENIKLREHNEATSGELERLANEKERLQRSVKDCEAAIKSKVMQIANIRQWTLRHGKTSGILTLLNP